MQDCSGDAARLLQLKASNSFGLLSYAGALMPCSIGPAGVNALKREGDGATPLGVWPLRQVFYRPDKIRRPRTCFPVEPLKPTDGWCDNAGDRNYNRMVEMPYSVSAEALWRDDDVYDVIVVLGFNDVPRVRGAGSAIFLHIARDRWQPTAGCLALRLSDLLRLVEAPRPPRWVDTRPTHYRTRRGFM